MGLELDSLEIRVQSQSDAAASGLDKLSAALSQLRSVAKGGSGLNSTVNQLTKLSKALSSLGDMAAVSNIASALKPLQELEKASGFISTVNALKKLPEVTKALSSQELQKFALQIRLVTKYMAPLATEMEKVSKGFAAFPVRIQRIIQGNSGLAASNKRVSGSFTDLAAKSATYLLSLRYVVSFLADCVSSINDYVENVNLFQVSMGGFYEEAFAYAQLVNEKLGIDASEWMRTQGVFMSIANGFGIANEQAYALSEGLTELSYDLSSLYNEDMASSALRLQSALAGEIEPIRRLGIAISEAALKEFALEMGITKSVESMTEQEKALLRTIKLMEGAANLGAIGDFARTLESPANALRVLNQQITQFKRAVGSVMIPVLMQVLPYLQAFVELLTEALSDLATLVGFTMPTWDTNAWSSGIASGASDATNAVEGTTDAMKELKNATLGIDELNILAPPDGGSVASGAEEPGWASGLEIADIWDKGALAAMSSKVDTLKDTLRPIFDLVVGIGAAFLAWKIAKGVFEGITGLKTALSFLRKAFEAVFGAAALNTALSALRGFAAACALQFNVAGGGLMGVLSVLKLIGQTALASPLTAIVAMAAQFANLYSNSEKFREGLSRVGEVMGGVFTVVGDVLGGIFTVLGDIGSAILNLFPESVKTFILNGIQTIKEALSVLDIGFGDFGITILGVAALFAPGGQLVGVALLAFEAITLGIRALGSVSEETWNDIKQWAVDAWSAIKEGAAGLWTAIKDGLASAWTSTVTFFTESLPAWWDNTVAPWFTVERWKELGTQAINGLFNGLSNMWERVKSWGSDLISSVKDALGIHSPSKEFAEIGAYSMQGLEQGFDGMSAISSMFTTQLHSMLSQASVFSASTKALIKETLSTLQVALETATSDNQRATTAMAKNYRTMATASNAAIQSIIDYLNAIPRNITTVHTIVTETVGGSRSGDIPGFASGGFPEYGQLFLANEPGAGPELVGTIGRQTAVANTEQIVQGIAAGVSEANLQQNALLREQNELLRAILEKEGTTYLDGKKLYKSVENAARNAGVAIMTGGVV